MHRHARTRTRTHKHLTKPLANRQVEFADVIVLDTSDADGAPAAGGALAAAEGLASELEGSEVGRAGGAGCCEGPWARGRSLRAAVFV
jgi:hypothetical protein